LRTPDLGSLSWVTQAELADKTRRMLTLVGVA
jgi:hypothetical protein